jgi:hypothetical protein
VLLFYSGGVILGTGLAALLWCGEPQPWVNPIDFSRIIGLLAASALNIAASACMLGVLSLLKSNRWRGRGPLFCMSLGAATPSIGLLLGDLAELWFSRGFSPLAAWPQSAWFWLILYAIPGMGAAFVLLRREPLITWKEGIAAAAIALTCIVIFNMHIPLADSIYERTLINYQPTLDRIAAWAKATFPARSVNSEITLPPQFPRLPDSQSEQIQAILVPRGPELILITLYQETSLSDGGPAIIYVTAPLSPEHFGTDSNGDTRIRVHGIWEHHLVKQLAPRLYLVQLNKDPDQ